MRPEVGVCASLYDGEQRLVVAVFGLGLMVAVEAAIQPSLGQRQRFGRVFARGVARGAFVESHHDVGADRALGVHDAFGGEEVFRTVDMRPEMASLLLELAASCEREDLEAAAVGEHRPFPGRETVYAPGLFDDLHAGAHVEVVGVRQDDLRPGLVAHVAVENAFDRGGCTHRHENRGADDAVVCRQFARAGFGRRILML